MWSLGYVNSRPAARGSQQAGFTQPRDHSFAQHCNSNRLQNGFSAGFSMLERFLSCVIPTIAVHEVELTQPGYHSFAELSRQVINGNENNTPSMVYKGHAITDIYISPFYGLYKRGCVNHIRDL